ncbi:hypothetical protein KI387_010155 [Taxus chinensis]|uniref:Pectinesterase n=1 Tax=Taxus chinensis TaxID=29808 RepID=A0AA38KIZ9_TAXCH|nr:hypothetical protein KI387_010155 [Taxus chinensis]
MASSRPAKLMTAMLIHLQTLLIILLLCPHQTTSNDRSLLAINMACRATQLPNLCKSSLSKLPANATPSQIIAAAMDLASAAAQQNHILSKDLLAASSANANVTAAANNCVEFMAYSIDLIAKSKGGGIERHIIKDIKAWMSASVAYQYDCASDLIQVRQQFTQVSKAKGGALSSIQAAVNAAPDYSARKFVIRIKAGVYQETVRIPRSKTNLVFFGEGMERTVITGSRYVPSLPGAVTVIYDSATVGVNGEGFVARDLTFENTYRGPKTHQAVALRVDSDLSAFYNCAFLSHQDTLYAHTLRQYYHNCTIQGTHDFIFGTRRRHFSQVFHSRFPAAAQVEIRRERSRHCARPHGPRSVHGVCIRRLFRRRDGRIYERFSCKSERSQGLFGAAVEDVLQNGFPEFVFGESDKARRMDGVERNFCSGYAFLRGVSKLRARS